jgi:SAM-dependent methyltransferase
LVSDRKHGVQAFYCCAKDELHAPERALVDAIIAGAEDPQLVADAQRMEAVLRARQADANWADSVAGDMERHYSPGRTWDAACRVLLQFATFGDVLDVASGDGVLAAARKRLAQFSNISTVASDMHAPALAPASFDQALLLQALPYSDSPLKLFGELARVLRPHGDLVGSALAKHEYAEIVAPFGHKNLGFAQAELAKLLHAAGFEHVNVARAARERKAPHFEVLLFSAKRPAD